MSAIEDSGLRVPYDISVVGFDDIPFSAYSRPSLTTIALPEADIARAAFEALLQSKDSTSRRRRGGAKPHVITPTLVTRRSTSPLKEHHQL